MTLQFAALGAVATVTMGLSPKGADVSHREGEGLPLLNGPTEFGSTHPMPRQWALKWARIAEPGDTLFCVRGSTTGRMNVAQMRYAIGRGIASIRGSDASDTAYIRYAIINALPNILSLTSGSVFPSVSSGDLKAVQIPWPQADQRARIAATLGALDDKIESNRRIVAVVPQLMRALVSQSLGADPREVAVAHLATFINGGAYTKGASGSGRIVIRIAELNSGPGPSTVYSDIDVPDDKTARPGDILMSWSGSLGVYRWTLDEAIVNQHIFKVLPAEGYPAWLVYDRLDDVLPVFQDIAKDKATTMGHIQRGHLQSTVVEVPSASAITSLDCQLGPLWERLLLAEQGIVKLSALRDTLLPELLSSRIRVTDTARLEETVA